MPLTSLRRTSLILLAALVALTLISGATVAPVAHAQATTPTVTELLQQLGLDIPTQRFRAPAFALQDLDGTPIGLEQLRGRVVMLYFWTTW